MVKPEEAIIGAAVAAGVGLVVFGLMRSQQEKERIEEKDDGGGTTMPPPDDPTQPPPPLPPEPDPGFLDVHTYERFAGQEVKMEGIPWTAVAVSTPGFPLGRTSGSSWAPKALPAGIWKVTVDSSLYSQTPKEVTIVSGKAATPKWVA
jgi:hypothetical protein